MLSDEGGRQDGRGCNYIIASFADCHRCFVILGEALKKHLGSNVAPLQQTRSTSVREGFCFATLANNYTVYKTSQWIGLSSSLLEHPFEYSFSSLSKGHAKIYNFPFVVF